MPQPYPGLSPEQLAVARALAEAPEWSWGSHSVGLRPDGALVEVMPGRALGMHRSVAQGLVPLITDPVVLGYLITRLEEACGAEVRWATGRGGEPERPSWWCSLEAGPRRRIWEGGSLGEPVGQALLARWEALRRREHSARAHLMGRERPTPARERLPAQPARERAA